MPCASGRLIDGQLSVSDGLVMTKRPSRVTAALVGAVLAVLGVMLSGATSAVKVSFIVVGGALIASHFIDLARLWRKRRAQASRQDPVR
jgi:protein-S-isoprenylcysteine O-methyltransferase Ste14